MSLAGFDHYLVNSLNNKWILSQLKDGDKYTITGHGLIKAKGDAHLDNEKEGGVGNDAAESEKKNPKGTATGGSGDNREPHGDARGEDKHKHHEGA